MHPNVRRVEAAARAAGLPVDVVRFPEGTRTAADAAAAIGCPVDAILKSIVVSTDVGPALVLLRGGDRFDPARVAAALGATRVTRADADTARVATGYPIGGTSPLGCPPTLPVLADARLLLLERVWAAAGTPDSVFAAAPAPLVAAAGATITDVAEPAAKRPPSV